jgi:hypothetical protein
MDIPKLTNKIAIGTVFLLFYWVFIFICTSVFGFKIFRENLSEVFIFSILGIFSILCAAIVINIMYNLTAIAESHRGNISTKNVKNLPSKIILISISLIIIFLLLYVGDRTTANKKEIYFLNSVKALVEEQNDTVQSLMEYAFSENYIKKSSSNIKLLSKIDEKFPEVTVIHQDQIHGKKVLLGFRAYYHHRGEKPIKVDFILSTSKEEREYLFSVFSKSSVEHKFSSNEGRYEIYYPIQKGDQVMVLHLSQYSRYGKIGS